MSKQKLDIKSLIPKAIEFLQKLRGYSTIAFLVLVGSLYGFILYRVDTLGSAQPSEDKISSHVKAAHVPHIDQKVVKQLKSLQDNSVSVKSLFDEQAPRSNPFQE